MPTIFLTGFPGFLGSELLRRLLARSPDTTAICLVQSKFAAIAKGRKVTFGDVAERIRLVEGDITSPGLGLTKQEANVDEIYHLAAIYDLAVERDVGMRINVEGTKNVLDFAESSSGMKRLNYISTCYVSGRHPGTFRETDLAVGQEFNNYYEETKYLAEVAVQERIRTGFPATVYRPSVVVGDSRTGETQKFDGPYYIIKWLMRQRRMVPFPVLGNATRYQFNVVPRDFIVEAIAHLSTLPQAGGETYQLADPEPLTVAATLQAVAQATNRRLIPIRMPVKLTLKAIEKFPALSRSLRIPAEAFDYFTHPTQYDTTNAQRDLAGSGISVPHLRDYLPRLVEFVRSHPEIRSKGMA
jgi:thioester reductase-like protein